MIGAVGFLAVTGKNRVPAGADETQSETQETVADLTTIGNVTFEGISLKGMTAQQAKSAIENWISKLGWNIELQYQSARIDLNKCLACPDELVEGMIAISRGGTGTLPEGAVQTESGWDYSVVSIFDEEAARTQLEEVALEYNKEAVPAHVTGIESGYLTFADEEKGWELKIDETITSIKNSLKNKNYHNTLVAEYNVLDSGYTLAQAENDYDLIGSFKTNTASANSARDTNISLACQAVNGTIVAPGETFSILEHIGDTTSEKGYQAAGAYSNGEVVSELGGGICQVSTTLYNAVVKAGLKTVERHNHSMIVHYVNLGEDAMISWPTSDFKFENNSDGYVLVTMYYYSNELGARVYGIPVLKDGITQAMVSNTVETYEQKPQYIEDATLQPGQVLQISGGDNGYKVETYLVTYQNGVEISREWLHNSIYRARNPVYHRNSSTPTTAATTAAPATEAPTTQAAADPAPAAEPDAEAAE